MPDPELANRFRRARTDPTLAVLEGLHPVKHALRFGALVTEAYTDDANALRALASSLAPDVAERIGQLVTVIDAASFAALAPAPLPSGIIALAARRPATVADALQGDAPAVLLESPAHGGNIGAAIRVAAGVGAGGVLVTGDHDPWSPAALRGSAGLHYAVPVARATLDEIPAARLVAVDPDGDVIDPRDIGRDTILAFGSERRGLSPALLRQSRARVRIPMQPGVSSLNLATAVAVVLYLWRMQS